MGEKRKYQSFLKIVCISDTHGLERELVVPEGDLLIHSGDISMFSRSIREIRDFDAWLGELPHRWKIVVPGNHEFFLEADPSKRSLISNAVVLINEALELEGCQVFGSPTTNLYGGAFGLSSAEDRRQLYSQIPQRTDILITHGPPFGILDSAPDSNLHSGCRELLDAVMRIRPKLHVFGHIHGAHGTWETNHTTFANASLLGEHGDLDKLPLVFRMTRE